MSSPRSKHARKVLDGIVRKYKERLATVQEIASDNKATLIDRISVIERDEVLKSKSGFADAHKEEPIAFWNTYVADKYDL